jgi:lipid II:glycine glycyltransferase (peptidoglycan interpeptide bridge formation enzyme)
LFNSYSIEEFKKWKEEMSGASGIQLKTNRTIRKVLYADDQVLKISKSESLQMVAHRLNIIAKNMIVGYYLKNPWNVR